METVLTRLASFGGEIALGLGQRVLVLVCFERCAV